MRETKSATTVQNVAADNALQKAETVAPVGESKDAPLTVDEVRKIVAEILREREAGPRERVIDFNELCARVPLSPRTLREAIKRRQIPAIRLPRSRRLLFSWESVRSSLLRFTTGGIE
jgi:hypothetical protein